MIAQDSGVFKEESVCKIVLFFIEMRLKSSDNRNYTLNIKADASVSDVRKMLAEEIEKPWEDILLIFENRICFPHESIGKYEIGQDDYVLFDWNEQYREFNREHLSCGSPISVIIRDCSLPISRNYMIQARSNEKICKLKYRLCDRMGTNSNTIQFMRFLFEGEYLDGDRTLESYEIEDGDTIISTYNMNCASNSEKSFRNLSVEELRQLFRRKYETHLEQIGGRPICVFTKDLSDRTYIIYTRSNETIRNLAYRLCDLRAWDRDTEIDTLKFVCNGTQLEYHRTLESYGIEDRCTIQYLFKLRGGGASESINLVPININRESYTIYSLFLNLSLIISEISTRTNEPPLSIELFSQPQSISQYKINDSKLKELLNNSENICDIYYKINSDEIELSVLLVPINSKGQSIEVCSDNNRISSIIEFLSNRFDVPKNSLKLYDDRNKTNRVKTDDNFLNQHEITRDREYRIIIYYHIKEIIENFIQNKCLGKGAFGTVYKCTEIGSNKIYAIKVFEITEQKKDSFSNELSVIKSLDHPRIVRFERQIDTDSALYLLMEYLPGGTLGSYVMKKALPEYEISKYSKQILEGLQYLHYNKIIHGDIKGNNILLDGYHNIKLCDFGLAKCLTKIASKDVLNGALKSAMGTANWMAPEIICGEPYGFAVDIWSFGATLVEMVTGRIPFYNYKIAAQVIFQIGTKKQIVFTYPEDATENLKDFINHCLRGDPSERATINDLLNHQFLYYIG